MPSIDHEKLARALGAGESVHVNLDDGSKFELTAADALVTTSAPEHLRLASDATMTVALDTRLTDGLRREGLAREFTRQINDLRKQLDLAVEDRITLAWSRRR